jgi:hypothetical protein
MMGEEEDAEITDNKEALVDASSDAPGIRPSVPNGDLRQGLLAPAVPIQTASTFGRPDTDRHEDRLPDESEEDADDESENEPFESASVASSEQSSTYPDYEDQ